LHRFQSFKVSEFQGFRVSRFQGFEERSYRWLYWRAQKKSRSLAEKLEAVREVWAVLGSFAALRMTLLRKARLSDGPPAECAGLVY
jgi:hypothetical protein